MSTTLPASNVTFKQVTKLRRNYEAASLQAEPIVAAYDRNPTSETLQAMLDVAKRVELAYKLWDQAHRECYGF